MIKMDNEAILAHINRLSIMVSAETNPANNGYLKKEDTSGDHMDRTKALMVTRHISSQDSTNMLNHSCQNNKPGDLTTVVATGNHSRDTFLASALLFATESALITYRMQRSLPP